MRNHTIKHSPRCQLTSNHGDRKKSFLIHPLFLYLSLSRPRVHKRPQIRDPVPIIQSLDMSRGFFPPRVSLCPIFQRAGNSATRHMLCCTPLAPLARSNEQAVAVAAATATATATAIASPPATPPLPPLPPTPKSVCRSQPSGGARGAVFTIAVCPPSRVRPTVRPTERPTEGQARSVTARPSFQVVEVEMVAHLPTDWKKREGA